MTKQNKKTLSSVSQPSAQGQNAKKFLGMGRHHIRAIKQYILVILLTLGGSIAALIATGYEGPLIKKLSIVFLIVLGFFAGLSAIDLVGQSDTAPDTSEVEQEIVSIESESADEEGATSLTGAELLQLRELITSRPEDDLYFVNEVIDGDTIEVGGDMTVRLLGINAPEAGRCYYTESRNELARLIQGKKVRLEKDVSGFDKYRRVLSYVFIPGGGITMSDVFVNMYMVENGYAQTYSGGQNKRYIDLFSTAQTQARMQERGLWGECDEYKEAYEKEREKRREPHEPPTDPNCVIKGNISLHGSGKVYYVPGCGNYSLTNIDPSKGEQYFCTEQEAQAAGFTKSKDCDVGAYER